MGMEETRAKAIQETENVTLLNNVEMIGRVHGEPKSAVSASTNTFYINFVLAVPKNAAMKYSHMNFIPCRMWGEDALKNIDVVGDKEVVIIRGKLNTFRNKSGFIGWQVVVEEVEPWIT